MTAWEWVAAMVLGAMLGGAAMLGAITLRQQQGLYIPCDVVATTITLPPAALQHCRRTK